MDFLPSYPWPYILLALSLSGFLGAMSLITMVRDNTESNAIKINKELNALIMRSLIRSNSEQQESSPERVQYEVSNLSKIKTLFFRDIRYLINSLVLLVAFCLLHIYVFIPVNQFKKFDIILICIDIFICAAILFVSSNLCKLYISVRPLLTYSFLSNVHNHNETRLTNR